MEPRTLTGNENLNTAGNTPAQFSGQNISSPAGGDVSRTLSSYATSLDPAKNEQTIMQQYAGAKEAVQRRGFATGQLISDKGESDIEQAKRESAATMTGTREAQRGFAVNNAQINNLQETANKRIRDLTRDLNTAMMNNDANTASALTELVLKEHDTVTRARELYVSNLIRSAEQERAAAGEARAVASEAREVAAFETPQQAGQRIIREKAQESVQQLAGQHPDAGISASDTLDVAIAKVQRSPSYQRNVRQGEAEIARIKAETQAASAQASAAAAAAGLSGAQAAQQRALTGFLTQSPDQDVADLLAGRASPEDIQLKYQGITGGAKNVLDQAQKRGYNLRTGTLTAQAQQASTEAASSGDITRALTVTGQKLGGAAARVLNPALGKFSVVAPNGKLYSFGSQKELDSFKKSAGIK